MDRHLEIPYERHDRVRRLIDAIRYCLESISLSFDGWNEPRIRGPGAYFAIVAGRSITDFADPMGDNYWPVDGSREVLADLDAFYEAAQPVALENDGGVVVRSMASFRSRWFGFAIIPTRAAATRTGWGPAT